MPRLLQAAESERDAATPTNNRHNEAGVDVLASRRKLWSVLMSDEKTWDDEMRDRLRETLRRVILGELRLAKRGQAEILENCREAYIQDECPEDELDSFIHFAVDELDQAATQLASEKTGWPDETDCDRLDRVEKALRERGILLWQVSPCCDTCTRAEISDRIDEIDHRHPDFRDNIRGYAFFIDQNMPEMLVDSTQISVYLAYGWFSPDGSEVAPETYAANALNIARQVCECLREEGFEANWDGDLTRKIGLSLNWQRHTMLE